MRHAVTMALALSAAMVPLNAAMAQGALDCTAPTDPSKRTWYDVQPRTIDGATSYSYKSAGNTDLRLHVFQPGTFSADPNAWDPARRKGDGKAPALLIFYGGGFAVGTVERFRGLAVRLASKGMVTILADYRVYCRNRTGVAEAVGDAKSAVRWVRSHAASLGIDPSRLAVGGGSAGGHLALATATLAGFDDPVDDKAVSARPDALVLFYPAVDLTDTATTNPVLVGTRARDLSPLYHIRRGLPPTLMLMGTADLLFPQTRKFCVEANKLGDACELITYEGAPHGFDVAGNSKPELATKSADWYADAVVQIDRFLARIGYLKRP